LFTSGRSKVEPGLTRLLPRLDRKRRALALIGALSFFGLSRVLPAADLDYPAIFGRKYVEAEQFLQQNAWIAGLLALTPAETRVAEAVVFPEVLRYRLLEDEIEVGALKVLYVQLGPKYANFSVGHFQMKPAFVEQLERDYGRLFSSAEKAAVGIPAFELRDSVEIRNARVLRLDDIHGQVRYLRLFMMIMDRKYARADFADEEAKVRFYATAYNIGYAQGERAIRKAVGERRFHVQLVFPRERYSYAEIAADYFRRSTPAAKAGPRLPGF
jgi:hypothetical protein